MHHPLLVSASAGFVAGGAVVGFIYSRYANTVYQEFEAAAAKVGVGFQIIEGKISAFKKLL